MTEMQLRYRLFVVLLAMAWVVVFRLIDPPGWAVPWLLPFVMVIAWRLLEWVADWIEFWRAS